MLRVRRHAPLALILLSAAVAAGLPADEKGKPVGLVVALRGHQEAVYGVAFSPDGEMLLTASGDPAVKVWDLASGKAIKSFAGPNGHTGIILGVVLSPDGTQFATAGGDNTARVWDFPSSKPLRELALKANPRAVAVTPDGAKVAGGATDGTIRVWNSSDGKQLHELTGHKGAITGLAFSPNGQVLASAGADSTLRYWNVAEGKALASFAAHAGAINGLAYAPGNNAVYTTGADGTLRYWALPPVGTRTPQAAFKDAVASVALSPDGSQIVVAHGKSARLVAFNNGATTRDFGPATDTLTTAVTSGPHVAAGGGRRLYVWQTKDGKLLDDAVAHGGAVTGVAFNPGGNQAATVGKDGWLRVWAVPPAGPRRIDLPAAVRAAAVTADGKRLAVGGADKLLRLYKTDNLKAVEKQFPSPAPVTALAVGSDVKTIASAGEDGVIRFWAHAKGDEVATITAHSGSVPSLELTGGGSQVLSGSADGTVKLWSVPGPHVTMAHPGAVTAAALSPDGARLLTGCADKQARLWDLSKGQVTATFSGPTKSVTGVAFSGNGSRVAAGSSDGSVWVYEAGGKLVQKIAGLPGPVAAIALYPAGSHVITALADGSVRVHDLKDGKQARAFTGHKGAVQALVLMPRGDQVYYAGAEGVIQSRNLDKAGESTIQHGAPVAALAIARDGALLAAGGGKQVTLYKLSDGKPASTIAVPDKVTGLNFSPDGKRLVVAGEGGKARVFTIAGVLEEMVAHDGAVAAALFSGDGKRLLTAGADRSARTTPLAFLWAAPHGAAVSQAGVSPRGDRVLSAGADGTLKVWNKADGKLIQTVRAHDGAVVAFSLSGDGGRAVTAGADKVARVWDLGKLPARTGGKELDRPLTAIPLAAVPMSVSLSPNGARVAVGLAVEKVEQVRVFDAGSGRELVALGDVEGLPGAVVAFQADNRTLLVAGADKTARLIDANILAAFEAHQGGATGVAYHSNGTQVLTAGADKAVKLWTVATGKLDRTLKLDGAVSALGFSRDFTQVAATAGKALKLWTLADGKEVASIDMPAEAAAVSFSQDKARVATGGADGRARVWDVGTKKEWQGFLHQEGVTCVAFHPYSQVLVTGGADRAVAAHTLSLSRLVAVPSPGAVAATSNGAQVVVACGDGKGRVYSAGNGNLDRTLEAGEKAATSVAASRNGQLMALGGADAKVRLYGTDGKLVAQITAPAVPRALGFSPDSKALVGGAADGSLTAWDTVFQPGQPLPAEFGKVGQTFRHGKGVDDLAFGATGNTLYSAAPDGMVKGWKLAAEAPIRTFNHPNSVNALAYDPKGERLATGCSDGRLRIFSLAKGVLERDMPAHGKPPQMVQSVYAVAFSPDGKQVATAGGDGALKLFDTASGKLVRELKGYHEKDFPRGHRDAVLALAFSPDGKQIASGGMDQTVKIWSAADGSVTREMSNPRLKPTAKGEPHPSHPGWVYGLRWTGGGKLISAGKAPRLRGYLATWEAASGKMLTGEELKVGSIFGLAVSSDEKHLAIGTGGSLRSGAELNQAAVMKVPAR